MAFKAIVKHLDGRTAVLTQKQLDLLPPLLMRTPAKKLDAALISACEKKGCPIDWDAQAE